MCPESGIIPLSRKLQIHIITTVTATDITRHGQKSENRATGFSLKKLGRTLTVPAVKIRFIAESNI